MSVWHNASDILVKFDMHDASGKLTKHEVEPGGVVNVPDCYDRAVPQLAPHMKQGPSPAKVAAVVKGKS